MWEDIRNPHWRDPKHPDRRTFPRSEELYSILRRKSDYQLEQLLKNRYNEAYKNRIEKRKQDVLLRYDVARDAFFDNLKNVRWDKGGG